MNEPDMQDLLDELARLRVAETVLKARVKMEALTAEISARFINMRLEEIEDGIRQSLAALAQATGVERAYLFLLDDAGGALDGAYEWCAAGVKAHPLGEFKGLSVDNFPWSMRQFLAGETIYVPAPAALPPEAAPEKGACDMLDIVSYVNVPVFRGGALAGWLGFDSVGEPKAWLEEDVTLLKVAGDAIVGALSRKRRAEELAVANENLSRANRELKGALDALEVKDRHIADDLRQARSFQQQILPATPAASFFSCRALYRPIDMVGGDIYDIHELSPGMYRFFVADATGHGVQAALRTMVIKTEYDRIKGSAADPARALRELNEQIQRSFPNVELPFTACCFDVKRGEAGAEGVVKVRFATAAHPGLLVVPLAPGGEVREIQGHGSYLGVLPDLDVELIDLEVTPGCRLLACTDGLLEANEGAAEALRAADRDLGQAVEVLLQGVEAFAASQGERADDATAVVIEFPA